MAWVRNVLGNVQAYFSSPQSVHPPSKKRTPTPSPEYVSELDDVQAYLSSLESVPPPPKKRARIGRVPHLVGDMAWILNPLNSVQASVSSLGSALTPSPEFVHFPTRDPPRKLNDYVYEVCKPPGRPSVEMVFFHGLQLGGSKDAHVTTWLSRSGSKLWLHWIKEEFPDARILTVSYDGFARKEDDQGLTDMYITSENLVHSLTDNAANVGQDGCPVVLVGHCLGGMLIKELLLKAHSMFNLRQNERVEDLLNSVKGVFYYSSPHAGTRFADLSTNFSKGPLFEGLTTLNRETARCNEGFRVLCRNYGWRTFAIAEQLPVTLGRFRGLLVDEASGRHGVDNFYTVHADHFDVCRPCSKRDSSFVQLMQFVGDVLKADVHYHKISVPLEVVGLNGQVMMVLRELKKTRHLGIVGTAGIGKTTLAKIVYNTVSNNFEYTCFLREFKSSITEQSSMEDLQGEILRNLYYKGRRISTNRRYPLGQKTVNWNTLKGKRVLIVLDDVEIESQVLVMKTSDDFSKESRVLVTSRDRGLLVSKDFEVHSAVLLNDEVSKRLFCRHAFKEAHPPTDYEDRVARFIQKCEGLPLALEVAGKYLYKKQGAIWDDVLEKLGQAKSFNGKKPDGLWSIFNAIYDFLEKEEEQMFLDIATCFHGEELETAKRAWRVCSWGSFPDAGLQNLLDMGLVTLTGPDKIYRNGMWTDEGYCRIQMHQVLRDLGHSRACHSRVSYHVPDQLPPWPFEQGKAQVKLLKIVANRGRHYPRDYRGLNIDIEKLRGLEDLEILWLNGLSLHGACNMFPKKLEFLKLIQCRWDVELGSRLEGWYSIHRGASSLELGRHQTLKHLDIKRCQDLKGLLDTLGQLPQLEYLSFERCTLRGFPNSFKQYRSLKHLRIDDYDDERPLPDSLGELGALEHLEIISGRMKGLPGTLGQLGALKRLAIEGNQLETIPDTLGLPENLEYLKICNCYKLGSLPSTLGKLKSLRELQISRCESLTKLPNTLGQLRALQRFEIMGCLNLTGLLDLGLLEALQDLTISDCKKIRSLGSLQELQNLRSFIVSSVDLKFLPDSLGELKSLKFLQISDCNELENLPTTLQQLQNLQHFIIDRCMSLVTLPKSLKLPQSLRRFEIVRCQDLSVLLDNIERLGCLEYLVISECDSLEALPNALGLLLALRHLVISSCPSVRTLPDSIGELHALERLEIANCRKFEALPRTLTKLKALQSFKISSCVGFKALPQTLGKLQALEQFEITDCHSLKVLPATITELRALRHFDIEWCHDLEPLRVILAKLQRLVHLRVFSRSGPEIVKEILGPLEALKHLDTCISDSKVDRVGELRTQDYFEILPCTRPKENWWIE